MRNAFAEELVLLAEQDPRIVLLSGDIGNRLFDPFKTKFPSRFYNCGVAEANMAGIAAGMAMCGLRPVTYTITPFNTTRCLEQIRNDICYHNVPVFIVGTGAGLSYASLGCTHHSCEDISFLRSLPNMVVVCPGDALEMRSLMHQAFQSRTPVYMRIGKTGEPKIHPSMPNLQIGKGLILQKGTDLCIFSTGNMLPTAMEITKKLESENISSHLISLHTVKPLDTNLLSSLASTHTLWITLEEHSLIGGMGASIAEWIADASLQTIKLLRFGTPDLFPHAVGSQNYLRAQYGLTSDVITKRIIKEIHHENTSCHPR